MIYSLSARIVRRYAYGSNVVLFGRRFSSVKPPATTSEDKMVHDKRYQAANEVPEQVLKSMHSAESHSPGFSIKGN